ncbi:FAD-dependent monooxygenase [Streptomyces sp. NBC_00009]|uniref:FAD-dependent monooxygenase n=1 Tax=Streptomyces sp. NBC_00009 TaxID=2975620 RepID=UPI003251FF58
MRHTSVVIAGGGPVGMLVAAEMGRYGIDTVVLEAAEGLSDQPKANTLHARAVQSLARCGYLNALPEVRRRSSAASFHFAGMPGLTITAPDFEPQPIVKCPQTELQLAFEARARATGVDILRGHRLVAVDQSTDQVELTVEGTQGRRRLRADYLVGADGAHSTVRKQLAVPIETSPPSLSAMMGVVRFTHAGTAPSGWQRTRRGWTVTRPYLDGHSLIRTVNTSGPHADRHAPLTLEELQDEASYIVGRHVAMTEPLHLTRFSDVTTLASKFRDRRVFLVGDAAHVHFPIGGQGLSTGIQDALNLGWKLAHAVRGHAGNGVLDTYDLERRPAAMRVIENTRAQLSLMRPDESFDALRSCFEGLMQDDQGGAHLAGIVSAQNTRYPPRGVGDCGAEGQFLANAALVTAAGHGDLVSLLNDGRMLLLLPVSTADRYLPQAQPWAALLNTVQVMPQSDLGDRALLVRPDGYIAWSQDGATPLGTSLLAWLGPGA